jgi:hypothetical protein
MGAPRRVTGRGFDVEILSLVAGISLLGVPAIDVFR